MPKRPFFYFDMGNVLLSFSHQRAAEQIAAVSGITAQRAWEIVFDAGLQWEFERGAINSGQFHHLFCAEAGCAPAFGKAIAIGLLPVIASAPPGAGISGRVFDITIPTQPCSAISRAYRPAVPK